MDKWMVMVWNYAIVAVLVERRYLQGQIEKSKIFLQDAFADSIVVRQTHQPLILTPAKTEN